MHRLEILHNKVTVGYQLNECIREGFLYYTVTHKIKKKPRRFFLNLLENVTNYSQTVSGSYVFLNSFKAICKKQVKFDLNVLFNYLLALQTFDLFLMVS